MDSHHTGCDDLQATPIDPTRVLLAELLAGARDCAVAPTFIQTNLISNGSVPAEQTDPNVINPWGVSYGPGGPQWISDNNTGLTSIDAVCGGVATTNVTKMR